ncbi:uncharacterized protein LOC144168288 [Haemaphysalis longicornis]
MAPPQAPQMLSTAAGGSAASPSLATSETTRQCFEEIGERTGDVQWRRTLCHAVTVLAATVLLVVTAMLASQLVGPPKKVLPRTNDNMKARGISRPAVTGSRPPDRTKPAYVANEVAAAPRVGLSEDGFDNYRRRAASGDAASTADTVETHFWPTERISRDFDDGREHSICDNVFYTYCTSTSSEFHYDPYSRECVGTLDHDGVQRCNHSPNRFPSRSACLRACVHTAVPEERCLDTPIFSECRSQDVITRQWHFTGGTCSTWKFPMGKCPANRTIMFATFADCLERCVKRPDGHLRCGPPLSEGYEGSACTVQELRYPFFAYNVRGSIRCLSATLAGFKNHRCLVGINRFTTKAACKRACIRIHSETGALRS